MKGENKKLYTLLSSMKINLGGIYLITNTRNLLKLLTIVLLFSMLLGACTSGDEETEGTEGTEGTEEDTKTESGEPEQGGNVTIGTTSAPTLFNDLYTTDVPSITVEGFIFNSLTGINADLEPEPQLSTDWEGSEDDLTWTFNLEEDVNWHDGEQFTAEDVVFTYSIPLDDDYTGPRANHFEKIDTITAEDDHTVKIVLKEPDAKLLFQVTNYDILPKHILEDIPIADLSEADFNSKNPIGTGPFKFDSWTRGANVHVVANDDYYEGRPNLDSITYKIVPDSNSLLAQFEAGDIDHMSVSESDMPTVDSLVEKGQAELEKIPAIQFNYFGYNLTNPLFEDKKVRQALAHGLDREEILETIVHGDGKISNTAGVSFSWAFNEDVPVFEYNQEKAKELLAEAGWVDKDDDGILIKDGNRFSFSLKTNQGNEIREKITQVAQQKWKEIGIEATPEIIEWSAFNDQIIEKNYDAFILGRNLSPDPSITGYFHTDEIEQGQNRGGYSNPELDKIMDESDQTMDLEERTDLIDEAQAIVSEDQPYTFLYEPNKNRIYVPQLHPLMHSDNGFYKIHEWWIEQ